MADVLSREKRSLVMSSIRGCGNLSTEWRLRARLISCGISGWHVNSKNVVGRPDFLFCRFRVAVFVDGCFWHGCRFCRKIPASNRKYWLNKINNNQKRDRKVNRSLRKSGWRVIRFWEHEMYQNPEKVLETIKNALIKGNGRFQRYTIERKT